MFSISTVASSTRMPTASARPPSVITLMVSLSRCMMASEVRMERGMETQTMMRAAPASQEQQNHQSGEQRGQDGFLQHALDRGAHEDGLVEHQRDLHGGGSVETTRGRICFSRLTISSVDAAPFFSTVSSAPRASVVADDVGLNGEAVAHMSHVLDVDGGSVDRLDGQIVECGRRLRAGCSADIVLVGADFHGARRQDDALVIDRVDDVLAARAACAKSARDPGPP